MTPEIDWKTRCERLEHAVMFAITDDLSGVPRTTARAKKALQDALHGREDPYVEAMARWYAEAHEVAVKEALAQLRAKAARPWWATLFPWRITFERRN